VTDASRELPARPPVADPLQEHPPPDAPVARAGRDLPARVPETAPTPLQEAFIPLSLVALICGAFAITALELGVPPSDPLVKIPVLVGAVLLAAVGADAIVRVWRSARAWSPIDRGRAAFRVVWIGAIGVGLAILGAVAFAIVRA
jgi:hypothetical protein